MLSFPVMPTSRTPAHSRCCRALESLLRPELFRALAEPTRLEVLLRRVRAGRPQTVTEVAGCCGVHLSGVSRHLAALRAAGVVEAERAGREVRYRPRGAGLAGELRRLADAMDACCPTEARAER
jgi:ArsR family transcriptional regulator